MMDLRSEDNGQFNFGLAVVPQQEAWVVERLGKFHRILNAGVNFLIPIMDNIKYVYSLKEIAMDIPSQRAITSDHADFRWCGVIFLRVVDAFQASYAVEDAQYAIYDLACSKMRSLLRKLSLDEVLNSEDTLNASIVEHLNKEVSSWGVICCRFKIRDIVLPARVKYAMQTQVVAERHKRAAILESEGARAADVNVAEGKHRARLLASEADKHERMNRADAEAASSLAVYEAKAKGIKVLADSLVSEEANRAAALTIASDYIEAFKHMANTSSTIFLPSNSGDVGNAVVQAMSIYNQLSSPKPPALTDNENIKAKAGAPVIPVPAESNLTEYFSDDEDW